MAKNNNLTDFLTDLANTIRPKKGYASTVKLNPQNFSSEISSISTSTPGTWSDYITTNSSSGVPLVKTSGTFPTSDRLYSINVDAVSMDTINLTNNGFIDTINIDGVQSHSNINSLSLYGQCWVEYIDVDYEAYLGTINLSDRGTITTINVGDQNTYIENIHLTHRGYVGTIDVDAECYIDNINNAGTIQINGSSQAGSVIMVDQAQLNLQDSTISTLSGYGDFTKLDTNHNSINIHHMQANSNLAVNVTSTSSTSSSASGGALKVTDHTGTYTIANNGVITKATMNTSASGSGNNKGTINIYPIGSKRYVNCSAGYHTTAEHYTINPYASSIAIPANTTTISISCSTGTSYITYGTSGTAAVSKSFTTTAATGIPAGTTEHSRCMHLNNNYTSSKTYTVKCFNSSGSLLATRTFSVNYRHNTLVFSSTSASSARTMYIQILLD